MKNFTIPFFLFVFTFAPAQEKVYLNEEFKVTTDTASAHYYKIEDRVTNEGEESVHRKIYWRDGQIWAHQNFVVKNDELVREGKQKYWYRSGEPFYETNFKNGKVDGELIAWWKNGKKRRHDFFKKDRLKKGTVWNENGQQLEHFPYKVKARFPGGNKAFERYLKEHLPVPEKQKSGTEVRVAVIFSLDREGNVIKVDVLEGAPHWYNAVTAQVLSNMPKWEPAHWFGEPVASSFGLPVTFRK